VVVAHSPAWDAPSFRSAQMSRTEATRVEALRAHPPPQAPKSLAWQRSCRASSPGVEPQCTSDRERVLRPRCRKGSRCSPAQ
jgi:hypothetical protein